MVAYRSASSNSGSSGTTLSVTKPAGVVSGDVIVAMQKGETLAEMTTPTGGATWQLLDTESSTAIGAVHAKLWIKQAGGSEPASYTFNKGSGNFTEVVMVAASSGSAGSALVASLNTGSGVQANTPGLTPLGSADLELRFVTGMEGV